MKKISLAAIALLSGISVNAQTNTFPTSGNAGVGTTSPSEKLEVAGSVKVSDALYVNGIGNNGIGTIRLNSPNGFTSIVSRQYDQASEPEGFSTLVSSIDANNNYLHLGGGLDEANAATGIYFYTGPNATTRTGSIKMMVNSAGNVGIGTTSPSYKLVVADTYNNGNGYLGFSYSTTDAFKVGRNNITGNLDFTSLLGTNNYGYNFMNGYVGIGTTTPDELLSVNGTIHSKEVKINLSGWSDYVFKPTYRLPALSAVKTYIEQNQHLPDVPSEEEMVKNGLNVGEMNRLLMRKVEELTLYLIEEHNAKLAQQKEIELLKQHVAELVKAPNPVQK